MTKKLLPIPEFYDGEKADQVFRTPYEERAKQAKEWRENHSISPAANDEFLTCLVLIDVQNTFCLPEFELYVGGRSGRGAVEDNQRLTQFIYKNLDQITQISATMDTHYPMQVFHAPYLINDAGENPPANTIVSVEDVKNGVWKFNALNAPTLGISAEEGQNNLLHYVKELKKQGKYELLIWPFHSMLGGIGHAMVSLVEEAIFFHSICRFSQPEYMMKGMNPATENYSVISPEVTHDAKGNLLIGRDMRLFEKVKDYDRVIIAGQASSHCVAASVADLLEDLEAYDKELIKKVFLLEDACSPVVIPGVFDFTDQAETFFSEFASKGVKRITTNYVL